MLSRIAESLFWIGRYVERADVTARILEVQNQLLVEDPFVEEEASCRLLLGIMGVEYDGPLDQRELMRLMVYDAGAEASIVSTLNAARESARRARETLSTEMWSAINRTWRAIPSGRDARDALGRSILLGTGALSSHSGNRGFHDEPRRGLALPGARPQHRTGRYDRTPADHHHVGRRPCFWMADRTTRLQRP